MHFDMNISEMVKDMVNITMVVKYEVIHRLSTENLHLTLAHSKGQGQDHPQFKYLRNSDR